MTLRILYNCFLVRLGLRTILPAEIINRKKVRECGEEMATTQNENIIFADSESQYARKEVIARLIKAADTVQRSHGLKLLIHELYRSPEKQARLRKRDLEQIVHAHPEYNDAQNLAALNKRSAAVGGSGHQTGGAVDLTLCDSDGVPLDMGTHYLEHNEKTATDGLGITKAQKRHRLILLSAMQEAGFVNYPGEWWHFCYGDRMWAAYAHKPYAIYGVFPRVQG